MVKHSPSLNDFHHLGNDGVLRSFSSRGEVIDYQQLSQEEFQLVIKSFEAALDPDSFKKLAVRMSGVDSSTITILEQLRHPGPEGCPLLQSNK